MFPSEAEATSDLPPVDISDLLSYLVLKTSFISLLQFKACKSYNQFVCGWVKDVVTRKIASKYLTTGHVSSYYDSYYILEIKCVHTIMHMQAHSSVYIFFRFVILKD